MIGVSKRFSKKLFQQNDPKSRTVIKEYLAKQGIMVSDNPNKYGVDLISDDGSLKLELEHRLVWEGEEFPFAEVNVPERKAKFFTENCVSYVIISRDYTRAGMIDGRTLRTYLVDENLKESSNRFVRENEYFYKVPATAFKWTKLNE